MQANRHEVYEEFQRRKTNPIQQERKREAEKLLAKQVLWSNRCYSEIIDNQSINIMMIGRKHK